MYWLTWMLNIYCDSIIEWLDIDKDSIWLYIIILENEQTNRLHTDKEQRVKYINFHEMN